MKKVISYSLYGKDPRYVINAIINAKICKELYPDWECRFYYDTSVPNTIIEKLKTYSNVTLINMNNNNFDILRTNHSTKMFWRFLAYEDADVVIFRDTDSYPCNRERDAVNQWLFSDKSLHLMREVQPGHRSKIMGGMWGLKKNNKLQSIIKKCLEVQGRQPTDQNYLSEVIYPLFDNDKVVHDDSNVFNDKTHDWPTPRNGDMFIGRTQDPPCEESKKIDLYNNLIRELL